MYCPYCGTKNADDAAVCINPDCGRPIPQRKAEPQPQASPESWAAPAQPVETPSSPATIGSLAGLIGGGLVVLGWFLPWISFGYGGYTLATGGNGPQLIIGLLGAGLLGGGMSDLLGIEGAGFLFLCFTLLLVAIVLIVPIFGFLAVLNGWRLFVDRDSSSEWGIVRARKYVEEIRKRLLVVLIMVVVVFVSASLVSVGSLGTGFWLTAVGALGGFLAALYALTQLRTAAKS